MAAETVGIDWHQRYWQQVKAGNWDEVRRLVMERKQFECSVMPDPTQPNPIEVRLTEEDLEELLDLVVTERNFVEHGDENRRERLHFLNNLANKLSLPLQKVRLKRG